MSRLHNEITLKEAISKLIDTYKLKNGLYQSKIVNEWEKIVGKAIAKYTTNIFTKDKTLFLSISSAPLRQELMMHQNKMIAIINEALGEEYIKEIIVKA